MAMPIRTAVIGAGYWGQHLIRNVDRCRHLQLMAVSDNNPRRLTAMSPTETLTDASSLIGRRDIDAIVIATPPDSHFSLAERSLLAGQHVLCEKPLTLSQAECDRLAALATASDLCLMVDCTPVYLDAIQQAQTDIAWEYVDSIRCVRTVRRAPRFRGELVWSLAPHDLAVVDFWIGDLPSLWTVVEESPTTVRLAAQYESGPRIEIVVGQEETPRREILVKGERIDADFDQRQTAPEPLQQVVSHFADCIRYHRQPQTSASTAAQVAAIVSDVVAEMA